MARPIDHDSENFSHSQEAAEVNGRNRDIADNNDNDYVVVDVSREDTNEDDDDQSWTILNGSERKNGLSAYAKFANHHNKIISQIVIDEKGETFFQESNITATLGDKVLHYFLPKHKFFVDDYYLTLKINYGQQIADQAFPLSLQQKAIQFGLSSEIVFNSLDSANLEKIKEFYQQFSRLQIMQPSSRKLSQGPFGISIQQEQEGLENRKAAFHRAYDELRAFEDHVNKLLKNTPRAHAAFFGEPYPDTRSRLTQVTEMLIQAIDLAKAVNLLK